MTLDLRLLEPLHVLLQERHFTRAASRCGLTQPAMTRVLQRARSVVGDELLARRGATYVLTPRGETLLQELGSLLPQIERAISGSSFDPATAEQTFKVAMTEGAATVIAPKLVLHLAGRSPGVRVEIVQSNENTLSDVAAGVIDVAVVWIGRVSNDLLMVPIFEDDFVCIVAEDHPVAGPAISLEEYLKFDHVIPHSSRAQEQILTQTGKVRSVGFRTPYIFPAVLAVASSRMILTIARLYASTIRDHVRIRILEAPAEISKVHYGMTWHSRSNDDAQVWLREQIMGVARQAKQEMGPD